MTRLSSVAQETITEEGQFQNPKPQSGRSRFHNLSISLVFKPLQWLGILLLWWRSIVECHKIYTHVKRAIVGLTKQEILSPSVTRWWTSPSANCAYTNLCFQITDRLSIDETGGPTLRNFNPNTTTSPQLAAWNCTNFEFHNTLTKTLGSQWVNSKSNDDYHFAGIEPEGAWGVIAYYRFISKLHRPSGVGSSPVVELLNLADRMQHSSTVHCSALVPLMIQEALRLWK